MCNLLFKQSLKKRYTKFTFFIVCSLLISENALGEYGKPCIGVFGPTNTSNKDHIQISFKFFEYEPIYGIVNSYLESFEVKYSTRNHANLIHLMSASTENQKSKQGAWIQFKDKKREEKIFLYLTPMNQTIDRKTLWKDGENIKVPVGVDPINRNRVWASIVWYPENILKDVILIVISAKWFNSKDNKTEEVLTQNVINPLHPKFKSNNLIFSNSSFKTSTAEQNNSVKVYKQAKTIFIEGAINEKIEVYTTTGILIKSMPSNSKVFQIPLPANQLYIVNVGQSSRKVAL